MRLASGCVEYALVMVVSGEREFVQMWEVRKWEGKGKYFFLALENGFCSSAVSIDTVSW